MRNATAFFYDRRLGTRTSDFIMGEDYAHHLSAQGLTVGERVGHYSSDWLTLPRILRQDDVSREDVFVDIGSGQGRMLLEAAMRYRFKRVIGVEVSEELATVAIDNVRNACGRIRGADIDIVCCDVLDYQIPPDATVFYLFNPFRGSVFDEFVKRLFASVDAHPRRVRVIYRHPREEEALLRTGRVRRVRIGRSLLSSRERNAHIVMYEVDPGPRSDRPV